MEILQLEDYNMKWKEWENCQLSTDGRVLKAENVDQLPAKLKFCFSNGFNCQEYQAKMIMKALYSDPWESVQNYNIKNEVTGVTFESGGRQTTVDHKLLKQFLQKSSTFFLGQDESPLLIVNKNYVVILAPAQKGKILEIYPLEC
jgi:hypothetical protein